MLTFKELAAPTAGWTLQSIHNQGSTEYPAWWVVSLMRSASGLIICGSGRDLELAWEQAVRAAENHDSAEP